MSTTTRIAHAPPAPLSLTIAAFAERAAAHINRERHSVTYTLQFTERMTEAFGFAEADYQVAYETGQKAGNRLLFCLTINTDDVDSFIADPEHGAAATGYVRCDPLGGRLPVRQGTFDLFVNEGAAIRHMLYRLYFADATSRQLTLAGFKDVSPGPLTAVWPETSTLYFRILDGHGPCYRRWVRNNQGAGWVWDPADQAGRLRMAADDIPGARPDLRWPGPGPCHLRPAVHEPAVAGLRPSTAGTAPNGPEGSSSWLTSAM
jgi:hypothetical protein